jgi:putative sterol carrier protein
LGDEEFELRVSGGELTVTRGDVDHPDAVLDTDQTTLLSLLRTDCALDDALGSGQLRLEGDRAVVEKFRRLFPLPEPVASTPAE